MASIRTARQWNPAHYLCYSRERLRPALDLLAQIPNTTTRVKRVVDLGCGTGNMTPFFQERWPDAKIIHIDTSSEMLDKATKDHQENPNLRTSKFQYIQQDFEHFQLAEKVDVIFSNAALHWVSGSMHSTLFPKLMDHLNPGGTFAFQIPDSRLQPSHKLMKHAGAILEFTEIDNARWVTAEYDPQYYRQMLRPLSGSLSMWTSTYYHELQGENPVYNFVASTGLGPYVNKLGGQNSIHAQNYLKVYQKLVRKAYPPEDDGKTIFPMKRFFVVSTKKSE